MPDEVVGLQAVAPFAATRKERARSTRTGRAAKLAPGDCCASTSVPPLAPSGVLEKPDSVNRWRMSDVYRLTDYYKKKQIKYNVGLFFRIFISIFQCPHIS